VVDRLLLVIGDGARGVDPEAGRHGPEDDTLGSHIVPAFERALAFRAQRHGVLVGVAEPALPEAVHHDEPQLARIEELAAAATLRRRGRGRGGEDRAAGRPRCARRAWRAGCAAAARREHKRRDECQRTPGPHGALVSRW
jgi:hypothetical protein